jgi:hypothetical protein
MAPLTAEIHALEMRLLEPLVRASPDKLAELLAADFVEFGSSGRAYDRTQIIAALSVEQGAPGPPLERTITDFAVRLLADNVALATYRVARRKPGAAAAEHVMRSSIWRRNGGRWQMAFHQGTRVAPPELPPSCPTDC